VNRLVELLRSAAFYPITGMYLAGVALGVLVVHGTLSPAVAVLAGALVTLTALLLAAWREIRAVKLTVNVHMDELVARIDELNALLVASGIVVPPTNQERQALSDADKP